MKPTGERLEEIHNSFLVVITTVFSLLLAAVSAASAQSPKVIMPSDIMSLRIPGEADEPQLSPDAKHLVFSVTESAEGGRQTTFYKLWLADVDGGASPHSLAMPFRTEFSPSWSSDGKYISFLAEDASQNGSTAGLQIFILEVENSKITKLTSQSGGIERYKWSPDGRQIAYLSRDQPTDQEKAAVEAGNDAIEVDKSSRFAQLWILDLSTRKSREVPRKGFEIRDIAWSPDATRLAITRAVSPGYEHPIASLVVIDVNSGELVQNLSSQVVSDLSISWSADGQWILFGECQSNLPNGRAWWPTIIGVADGKVSQLFKDQTVTVVDANWTRDSKALIAYVVEGTRARYERIEVPSMQAEKICELQSTTDHWGFSEANGTLAYLNESPQSPPDFWIKKSSKASYQITHLNPQVSLWALGSVREVQWKNRNDGLLLYGVLILPLGYQEGKRYPMIVQAHQGNAPWWSGWLASWSCWGQLLASHGYAVFLPNTRGVLGQGWKLASTIDDWGGAAYEDLVDGVDYMVKQGIADPDRLGIAGWSNGGFMTEYAITHTNRFKAAVTYSGLADFFSLYATGRSAAWFLGSFKTPPYLNRRLYDEHSPITNVKNCKTPTLIIQPENDEEVPLEQGKEFYQGLKSVGTKTELVVYPREGHLIQESSHQLDLQRRVLRWFDENLK